MSPNSKYTGGECPTSHKWRWVSLSNAGDKALMISKYPGGECECPHPTKKEGSAPDPPYAGECPHTLKIQTLLWKELEWFNDGFYPRPVLASGYCHRLCLCARVYINHLLVRMITRHQFIQARITKFGSEKRERNISLSAFLGTEDIGVHIVHISHVIITYTLE